MKLVIMRHGEAGPIRALDEARSLTHFGEMQAAKAGEWLAGYVGNTIDLALVSSFVRADQTYQQVCKKLSVTEKVVTMDVIPEANPQVAYDYIQALIELNPTLKHILIVSHMPFVSYLIEQLSAERISMLFATASIAVLDYDPELGSGHLEVVYHPE